MNQIEQPHAAVPSERPLSPLVEKRPISRRLLVCGDGRRDTADGESPAAKESGVLHIFGGIYSPALIVAELAQIDKPNGDFLDVIAKAAGGQLQWHTDDHHAETEEPGCKHVDSLMQPEFAGLYNPDADDAGRVKAVERAQALYRALRAHPLSRQEEYKGGHTEGRLAINDSLDVTPVSPDSAGRQTFIWDRAATMEWATDFVHNVVPLLTDRELPEDFEAQFKRRLGEHMAATKKLLVDEKGLPTVVMSPQGDVTEA